MKTSGKSWLRGLTAAGLVMALAAWAPAQQERGDDAPRDEGRSVLSEQDDLSEQENRAAPPAPRGEEAPPPAPPDAQRNDDAQPIEGDDEAQGIQRNEQRFERQDARDLREPPASPSDLQPIPQNEMRRDMRFQQRGYTRGSFQGGYHQPSYHHHHAYDPCCCGGGQVMYHQGYRSAHVAPQSGYRSFSYQPSEPVAAPAPLYNGGYVSDGYIGGSNAGYGVHSSPRWQDRDARSFGGNYSSRATVHHGR